MSKSVVAKKPVTKDHTLKNRRVLLFLLELHGLDKSQAPADEARRAELHAILVAEHEDLCRAALAGFVKVHSARHFSADDLADLLQEARAGLWKAILNFDPFNGNLFCTYAYARAFGEMRHALRDRIAIIREPAWHQDARARRERAAREGRVWDESHDMVQVPVAHCAGLPSQDDHDGSAKGHLDQDQPDFAPGLTDSLTISEAFRTLSAIYPREMEAVQLRVVEEYGPIQISIMLGCSEDEGCELLEAGLSALRFI